MGNILEGIKMALSINGLLLNIVGVFVGIIFGAVPGLSSIMAIALFLPFTFGMSSASSMSLLIGLYIGSVSGGLISAILLNIPGTANSIATTFEGYPMAKKGEGGKAISNGIIFSFLGGLFSMIILFFVSPILSDIAIQFTPFDYFAIVIFSLTMMASLSGGSILKGLMSGLLGMTFTFVGMAPIDAVPRFTFGSTALLGGFSLLPFMLGTFAVTEVIALAETVGHEMKGEIISNKLDNLRISFDDIKSQFKNFIRSSFIGTGIGILPGIGGGVANLLAYSVAKNRSKHPEKFGTGILDGIVASESANNASIGGAMIPLLSLGIPGDATTALLIGGFIIHGVTPGPLLIMQQPTLVYSIFATLIIANIIMLILEFASLRLFIKLFNIQKAILLPVILTICVVGAFGNNNRVFDVILMFIFGIIAYFLKKFEYPIAPMVIGFILSPLLESNFRRALMYSNGDLVAFISKPLPVIMFIISIISLFFPLIKNHREKARKIKEYHSQKEIVGSNCK